MKEGVEPAAGRSLDKLHAVGSTGSPLSPEAFAWIYDKLGADTWLFSTSGRHRRLHRVRGRRADAARLPGELQAPSLGCKVEAWSEDGRSLVGEVGELVITEPMPSMPVFFWGDPDGSRYRESYFEMFPGIWRHGDWIELTDRHTAIIYGRSDSTINRGGVRMGTSEIYRAVLADPDVTGRARRRRPARGRRELDAAVRRPARRRAARRRPRQAHQGPRAHRLLPPPRPNDVHQIAEVPRTLSGKVLEVPVKRILMGTPAEQAASRDSLANPPHWTRSPGWRSAKRRSDCFRPVSRR